MLKKYKFEVGEQDWNYVEEKGLPDEDDGMWCILVVEDGRGGYHYEFGGYNVESNTFYVNFGYGGCVIEAASVVAWAPLFTEETQRFLKVVESTL